MTKILITGGAGFIGVNSAEYFLNKGWEVVIFDNFSREGADLNRAFLEDNFKSGMEIVEGDIRTDTKLLTKLCDDSDVVLHLAAQVAVTTSLTDPRTDFDTNALGTFNVLEAVRASKNQPIILYASTNKVYGGLEDLPVEEGEKRYSFAGDREGVSEEQNLDFHSPYGCSKGAADQYVRDYSRIYGLRTVVLRQSCIYGPHQMGIEDQGWVAWFMIAAMLGKPVTIYGNGKQVRDLLYIDDLVAAYATCIEKIDTASGQIFNLGGGPGNTLSLIEFLNQMEEMGMEVNYSFGDTRPGDQPIFISDNSKAEKILGWKQETNVEQGLKKLLDWLKENKSTIETLY